jgi:hypothetical protein
MKLYFFYCGGGLRDWEESDEPCTEHARWHPNCLYVTYIKGKQFIQKFRRQITTEEVEVRINVI